MSQLDREKKARSASRASFSRIQNQLLVGIENVAPNLRALAKVLDDRFEELNKRDGVVQELMKMDMKITEEDMIEDQEKSDEYSLMYYEIKFKAAEILDNESYSVSFVGEEQEKLDPFDMPAKEYFGDEEDTANFWIPSADFNNFWLWEKDNVEILNPTHEYSDTRTKPYGNTIVHDLDHQRFHGKDLNYSRLDSRERRMKPRKFERRTIWSWLTESGTGRSGYKTRQKERKPRRRDKGRWYTRLKLALSFRV
ncbi:Hypothetical protein NTJ_11342 [Nesidiocoris tenuis]|uniref:Uncharacterized protein n=1 Tax=Nesidiocoris tenuis TaxID=355587 RepID=A0ABN7B2P5_9HEMI|nr:Hypothetical protein NTJ_11342 [Nesidiocoris tenuis]